MSDSALLNLKEPEPIDWENYNPGSKYVRPPDAVGVDGKPITYFGTLPKISDSAFGATDEGLLQVVMDPIVIVKSGQADGYQLRFSRFSVKKFTKKDGTPINASALGNLLRAAGVVAKPQKNEEYKAAAKSIGGRVVGFTLDWYAKNKETGEEIRGYASFPDDPERPGQKKAILKAGDLVNVLDDQGNVVEKRPVQSEVLFANARLRYIIDPNRK